MFNGILNLNKPEDWTSHDVVARVRRILGQRNVGHAGTLDPLATGVLLVCAGQATRVAEYLTAGEKVYRSRARLGVTTDTYDATGQIVATSPVPELTSSDLERALVPFVGDIQQTPPAFSAIKQDGMPVYRRARRGEQVELQPRPVSIRRIDIVSWQTPDLLLEIECGPGTYIRSLVHDLGLILGCGAVLTELTRVRSGRFSLADAVTLEVLTEAASAGHVDRFLHPLDTALTGLVRVEVDATEALRLVHGLPLTPIGESESVAGLGYAVGVDGEVVAILQYDSERHQWRPHKVFASANAM